MHIEALNYLVNQYYTNINNFAKEDQVDYLYSTIHPDNSIIICFKMHNQLLNLLILKNILFQEDNG